MSAISRLGSGRVAGWFNGWWVTCLAILLGVGGPLLLSIKAGRPGAAKKGAVDYGFLADGGKTGGDQNGVSPEEAKMASDTDMSKRLQLTVALSMSASLRVRKAQIERGLPVDTGALYAGMERERIEGKPLLPKQLSGPMEGSTKDAVILSSSEGLYLLRYKAEGGGRVEVISVSKRSDGAQPAMMARVPDDRMIFGDKIGFYTKYETVPSVEGAKTGLDGLLEPAFADSTKLVGVGWRIVKLALPSSRPEITK